MARTGNVRFHLSERGRLGVILPSATRRRFIRPLVTAFVLCAGIMTLGACSRGEESLVLATTTSVGSSGLLDRILPAYPGAPVRALQVGSGRALEMLAAGTADIVISHAPARERAMLDAHPSWWYRKILFNDFVIAGPPDDPADVRSAVDAVDAMRRIARSNARFLSRGDESGTHERELELWSAAGSAPDQGRHIIAGAGMGQTLRITSGTSGYTLTDRGTFEALAGSIDLVILHSGDDRLLNTYAVIADSRRERGAQLARWLAEGPGRDLMRRALSEGGVGGFTLWPEGAERDRPAARPD
jgi:tungstate transport system substrate-binding protein